ncbi:MAG TPA: DUF1080 domain-containing protein [Bryobacteraceae bacterium]|nr:DUF1080 domain-containing protein [Bryobacteraceae bacterium]
MRKLRILAIVAALAGSAAAADNQLTAQEKADGWQLLFDGKTYAGWEDPTKKVPPADAWTIEDGSLKAMPHPRIVEDLFTKGKYHNFELVFDWTISPGGNSGVKYRIQDRVFLLSQRMRFEDLVELSLRNRRKDRPARGQEYVIGFEYQIVDDSRNPDARRGPKYQAGALYDMSPATQNATRPVGEYNHSRIIVKGDHVEHWLNGVKVVDAVLSDVASGAGGRWGAGSPVYEMLVKHPRADCQISLQNHNDTAWFKNIKIHVLP